MSHFLDIEPEFSAYASSKVIIVPAPYEKTTTYGKGTKNGPAAILQASQIVEDYDIELQYEPCKKLGIHTLPALKLNKDPHDTVYETTKRILQDKKFPFLLGGEHSISFGAIKAAREAYPHLSVLQFDAHADLRDSYHGSKHNHACIMRRVREMCPAVQVGIRSQDIEESRYLTACGGAESIFYAHDFDESRISAIEHMLTGDVYITFDVDALDPSIMPSTGTPEPGGLLWYSTLKLLKKIFAQKNVVGADLVELSPNPDCKHADFTAAKLVYKMIGYLSAKKTS